MAFRDGPFENIKVPLAWTAAVVVVVALIASIVMIVGDRGTAAGRGETGPVRAGFVAVAGPVGGIFAAPVRWTGAVGDHIGGYFFAISENRRLKAENAELKQWRDQAIAMKTVNERYEALMGIRTDPPVPMAAGATVQDSRGPFARARLIDVGAGKGVRIGNPVMNEHGLVGRVVGTTAGISRVLLLTDVASRTPVLIERTDQRALLTGDASANPRLAYVRGTGLKAGDRVLTSGDGGGFPRGLPVGIVAKGVDGSWRVKLFSDRGAVDYVRVLLFQSFGQLADPNGLNAPPLAGLGSAPPPNANEAAAISDAMTRRTAADAAATAARDRRIAEANADRQTPLPAQTQTAPSPDSRPAPLPSATDQAPTPVPGARG
ncbi:rod shape-determining protein MreC [Brevundimonas variabilis]|uniref:Cell shape-determining protein MreC n=1 Tax=Brevundimonas variabilis TaxID=74312 RepID=A0A7W9CI63_9CAUL|nr:rod shape-determining protein MreC [Brevundimonas variabilis]